MEFIECVAERTDVEPEGGDRRPRLPARRTDPDATLVEQLREGDGRAVEALAEVYGDRVYRLALRITGSAMDAEEVVQDVLWTVSRKVDTFRGAAAFGSWVYRISANAAYQKLRGRPGKRNDVSWEDVAPSFDETGQRAGARDDWSKRLRDPAVDSELTSVLSAAINELPAKSRTTFLLRDVEGLSNNEIAKTLCVTPGTIKSRVHRARLFLQRRLAVYLDASFERARRRAPSIATGLQRSSGV